MSRGIHSRARGGSMGAAAAVAVLALLVGTARAEAPAPAEPAAAAESPAPEAAPEDLARALERLAKQEFDLTRALASAQLDVESARRRFDAAQQRLDADPDADEVLREEVAARRLQLETEQRIASLFEERIARVKAEQEAWRRLHRLEREPVPPETLAEWESATTAAADELAREVSVKQARLEEVRQDLVFTREQAEALPASSPRLRWARARARALEQLVQRYEEDIAGVTSARELSDRLAAAITRESRELPLAARLRTVLHQLRVAWNYELTGSEKEPITPGKIISALGIFLIGWFLARVLARLLGQRVFPRLRLEEGAARAFESLAFYFLLLVVFLTALRMVQIPLTAFAVVGGALAIGVGFGSQNVVNNFISGIILLAERPIKLGDLIEVEGVYGNVERIGLRSTRVRTGDNVHIIVPNAAFLENKVVNWTHSDARVRVAVEVGVAYGSPTREVERRILAVLRDQQGVLPSPEPVVLFREFGDNALIFETRFWVEVRTVLARLRIESEVRYRIDESFREADIVIAFPQRDVHLDSLRPVEVRLVPGEEEDVGDREA